MPTESYGNFGLTGGCAPTPAAPPASPRRWRAQEGKRGTSLTPARPAHTPDAGSLAKPLPGLSPHYAPPRSHNRKPAAHGPQKRCPEPLDTKRLRYARRQMDGTVARSPRRAGRSGHPPYGLQTSAHGRIAVSSRRWRRSLITADRVTGGNLDKDDPDAVGVLDPHLDK